MPIDYALAKRLHTKHKGALTRARKKGARAVVEAVNAFYYDYRYNELPLPDDWHTWDVAKRDALFSITREDGY
jgi:hypothetical protein